MERGRESKTSPHQPWRAGAPTLSPRLLCPHTPRPAPFLPSSPQAVDYAINSAWKSNNKGKLYEDCVAAGTIGGATGEEE